MPEFDYALCRCFDLNLLPIFLTVIQERSITKAAITLQMSQPAVSNAMSRLKRALDDELFFRNGHGVEPTKFAINLFNSLVGPFNEIKVLVSSDCILLEKWVVHEETELMV